MIEIVKDITTINRESLKVAHRIETFEVPADSDCYQIARKEEIFENFTRKEENEGGKYLTIVRVYVNEEA